jgi:hypothetical protein
VTESGGRTALLGPAVLRLAEGVLLSVWRHGLLSPLDQLFSCALRARLRTRCQRLLCANMHHSMQSSSGSEESRFFGLVHVGDATCVCRQRPRRRIWRRRACNHPWRAERAGIFSGFCVSDDAIFASVRGSDGEYATRVFVPGGGSRVTVGSDVTVALLTRNVSVNVSCSALMVRCPLSVVCASCAQDRAEA